MLRRLRDSKPDNEKDGRVVSNFINQALRDEPITIYGDGSQTSSFRYVDDLVSGLIRLMESPDDFTGPVNMGNPNEFTISELADCVLALTGSRSEIRNLPLPPDDPKQRQPDISLARDKLGWVPRIQLERGLPATIDYFNALHSAPETRQHGARPSLNLIGNRSTTSRAHADSGNTLHIRPET